MKKKLRPNQPKQSILIAVATFILLFAANFAGAQIKDGGSAGQSSATPDNGQTAQAETFFNQGVEYANAGDYKKAIKAWEQTAKLAPTSPTVFFNLGTAYYNTKQYSKAIASFQEALRLKPDDSQAKENLAAAEAAEKEKKEKRRALWSGIVGAVTEAVSAVSKDDENKSQSSQTQSGGATNEAGSGQLSGRYSNSDQGIRSFTFSTDGTFQRGGASSGSVRGGTYVSGSSNSGTYSLNGNVLNLKYEDGRAEQLKIQIITGESGNPYRVIIDGVGYTKVD